MNWSKKEKKKINFQEDSSGKSNNKIDELITELKKIKIPKTSQQTLPWEEIYSNGIIKVREDLYCVICSFTNINYKLKKDEEQKTLFKRYCDVLNSLDPNLKFQLYLSNRNIDENEILNQLKPKSDKYEDIKEDYEKVIEHFVHESYDKTAERGNYFVLGLKSKDTKHVASILDKAVRDAATQFKILNSDVERLKTDDMLELLFNFYNFKEGEENDFILPKDIFSRGVSIKDYLAPSSFKFRSTYTEMGTAYSRSLYVRDLPNSLSDSFISDLLDNAFTISVSIHIEPTDPGDAVKFINRKITGMERNKFDYNKKNARQGTSYIPHELRTALKEAERLLNNLTEKNKKMFMVGIYINIFAETLEDLEDRTKTIQRVCRKHLVLLDVLSHQQEDGLATVLPLCNNKVGIKRTLLTDSTAILIPFSSQYLFQKGGFMYGINQVSNSLVVIDRRQLKNSSGFILGTPGSGKSLKGKCEIVDVLLNTDDDVICIDPENEYLTLCENFSGEHINISSTSNNYINPMDLSEDYADDDGDPVQLKSEFILSICETLIGKLSSQEKTIVDRCVIKSYRKFVDSGYNQEYIPTLVDFYNILKEQPEPEANSIALGLELYIEGSLNTFSHKSNITLKNRFTVFSTKDLGKQLKKLGILITLDCVWNRVCHNRANGKRTWIYTDEFYLLFDSEYSSNFYFELYKRARKWGGIPTGITQNISDLLKSDTARTMLSNSEFIILMNQAPVDRIELQNILQVGENQMNYVKDAKQGSGLILCEGNVIPFSHDYPKENKIYKMITTKIDEVEVSA